jgi:hypothetical protein
MTTTRNRAGAALITGRARSAVSSDPVCAAILAHHALVAQYIARFNEDIPRRIIDECDEMLSHVIFNIQDEAKMKRAAMDLPRRFAEVVFNSRSQARGSGLSVARKVIPPRGRLRYDLPAEAHP